MNEINILDSLIFNRIAAGEVVEGPSSIVKELVENSIDAGATIVNIEIKDGGTTFIKISDNGKGMSKDDVPRAFLPHATSKIKTIDDLNSIGTLGFRGEAISSIASVAKITITSRKEDAELGFTQTVQNGKNINYGEIGCQTGTSVLVENLFENVPARKKFMKKNSAEAAKITELVQKLILANINVSIKYSNEKETIFHSSGSGLESAIYNVYGENLTNLSYVYSTMPDITLKGYVSKPSFSKSNRNFQTLIVNGRVVENSDISYYVYLCYQEYLMKRQFPMFILYINIPLDMVDVNVHPNKLEVKFSDVNKIKHQIFSTVNESINKEIFIPKNISSNNNTNNNNFSNINTSMNLVNSEITATADTEQKLSGNIVKNLTSNIFGNNSSDSKYEIGNNKLVNSLFQVNEGRPQRFTSENMLTLQDTKDKFLENANELYQDNFTKSNLTDDIIIIGTLFNTFIIVQQNSDSFFIDQHAAHEKILYDKLIESIDSNNIILQDLLVPYVFEVSYEEKELIESRIDEINNIGFILSSFGENHYSLSSIPSLCANVNLKEFISTLIFELESKTLKKSQFIKDKVASIACKAAVKGSCTLQKEEIAALLREMSKSGNALFCPHGRPTVIKITKTELEKWFKRIT